MGQTIKKMWTKLSFGTEGVRFLGFWFTTPQSLVNITTNARFSNVKWLSTLAKLIVETKKVRYLTKCTSLSS